MSQPWERDLRPSAKRRFGLVLQPRSGVAAATRRDLRDWPRNSWHLAHHWRLVDGLRSLNVLRAATRARRSAQVRRTSSRMMAKVLTYGYATRGVFLARAGPRNAFWSFVNVAFRVRGGGELHRATGRCASFAAGISSDFKNAPFHGGPIGRIAREMGVAELRPAVVDGRRLPGEPRSKRKAMSYASDVTEEERRLTTWAQIRGVCRGRGRPTRRRTRVSEKALDRSQNRWTSCRRSYRREDRLKRAIEQRRPRRAWRRGSGRRTMPACAPGSTAVPEGRIGRTSDDYRTPQDKAQDNRHGMPDAAGS